LINRKSKRRFGADRIGLMRGRRGIAWRWLRTDNVRSAKTGEPAAGIIGCGLGVGKKRPSPLLLLPPHIGILQRDTQLLGPVNLVFTHGNAPCVLSRRRYCSTTHTTA
jgi:hypothetical protein